MLERAVLGMLLQEFGILFSTSLRRDIYGFCQPDRNPPYRKAMDYLNYDDQTVQRR